MHAVVLVGGFGTRLRPLTNTVPKSMLPIAHVPLIVRLPDGTRAGERVATPVQLGDVVPTVLDVAGLAPDARLGGFSLRGALPAERVLDGGDPFDEATMLDEEGDDDDEGQTPAPDRGSAGSAGSAGPSEPAGASQR